MTATAADIDDSIKRKLIQLGPNSMHDIALSDSALIITDMIEQKFIELYRGVGKLKDIFYYQAVLHIDKSFKPVAQCHRRILFKFCRSTKL